MPTAIVRACSQSISGIGSPGAATLAAGGRLRLATQAPAAAPRTRLSASARRSRGQRRAVVEAAMREIAPDERRMGARDDGRTGDRRAVAQFSEGMRQTGGASNRVGESGSRGVGKNTHRLAELVEASRTLYQGMTRPLDFARDDNETGEGRRSEERRVGKGR